MQLNPFEIKAEITKILKELEGVKDFDKYEVHYRILDAQSDKTIISKLLFKEINNPNSEAVKYLLLRYCEQDMLINKLWEIIKSNLSSSQSKIFALDLLREIDTNWTYEDCGKFLDNPNELVDSDTKKILDNAIANPEVQIDFLDFLNSLPEADQIILLNSLANDYSKDELANMLIPVFLSMPNTETGMTALSILGNSKSQLAYHALNNYLQTADEKIISQIKKNLSILKLAGIREDNTKEFYKQLLKSSKPYRFCITYPDGHGNQAVIFSRTNGAERIQFVAIVIDDYKGIRDCFGFNDISKFECNAIIDRFYRGQRAIDLNPEILVSILQKAETLNKNGLPYEYICWKNLLFDIEPEHISLSYNIRKLNNSEFEEILKSDFTDFWFLDEKYSDEFEDFIELANKTNPRDFDKIIEENVEKIFFPSEKKVWTQRILNVSLLKKYAEDQRMSEFLYCLYNDKILLKEFFKNIIRKSLYEYYFAANNSEKIQAIEEMWVK